MEHIGAGLAALGVFGPGIGIGILAGLSATGDRAQPRRGRPDPRHRDHPRGVRRRPRRPGDRRRPARDLHQVAEPATEKPSWICWPSRPASGREVVRWPPRTRPRCSRSTCSGSIVSAAQLRAVLRAHLDVRVQARLRRCWTTARRGSSRASRTPSRRGATARAPRPSGSPPWPRRAARRTTSWPAPRRSPRRPATRTSPRPRRSSSGCASAPPPRSRPRSSAPSASSAREVADLALAAAGRVVGETMTGERQRRLVEEFLAETGRRRLDGSEN